MKAFNKKKKPKHHTKTKYRLYGTEYLPVIREVKMVSYCGVNWKY